MRTPTADATIWLSASLSGHHWLLIKSLLLSCVAKPRVCLLNNDNVVSYFILTDTVCTSVRLKIVFLRIIFVIVQLQCSWSIQNVNKLSNINIQEAKVKFWLSLDKTFMGTTLRQLIVCRNIIMNSFNSMFVFYLCYVLFLIFFRVHVHLYLDTNNNMNLPKITQIPLEPWSFVISDTKQNYLCTLHVVAALIFLYGRLAVGAGFGVGEQPQTVGSILVGFTDTSHWPESREGSEKQSENETWLLHKHTVWVTLKDILASLWLMKKQNQYLRSSGFISATFFSHIFQVSQSQGSWASPLHSLQQKKKKINKSIKSSFYFSWTNDKTCRTSGKAVTEIW